MRSGKKELWENLMVVWESANPPPERGPWFLTRVVNHRASADPSAPKRVTLDEISASEFRGELVSAASKEEAILKYAASGTAAKAVWSIKGGKRVQTWGCASLGSTPFELVKEDF